MIYYGIRSLHELLNRFERTRRARPGPINRLNDLQRLPNLLSSLLLVGLSLVCVTSTAAEPQPSAPQLDPAHSRKMAKGLALFKQHVRPVLVNTCLQCHGGAELESEFDLSTREGLLAGGEQGPAVIPGNAKTSLLYKLITHTKEPEMPVDAPRLSDETVARIAEWINLGAPYDKPLLERDVAANSWTEKNVSDTARDYLSLIHI